MKTLTSLFMALLFCFGCSQSKDMYPIDVIKIDPIPPPMDMTSTVDSGIKCGARELKTDEGCVPCSVIVPDDYPTINQAVGKGDVVQNGGRCRQIPGRGHVHDLEFGGKTGVGREISRPKISAQRKQRNRSAIRLD